MEIDRILYQAESSTKQENPTNLKTVNSCSEFLQQLDSDYDWIGLRLLSKQAQIHLKMKMHTKG